IKIGLLLFFICNLDININLNKENNNYRIIKENFQEDINWLNEKYNCAHKLGVQYSPELYFNDIAEIQLKKKANDFDYRADIFIANTQTKLVSLFHDNVLNNRKKMEGSEYDSFIARLASSQKKYEDLVNPGDREKRGKEILKMHEASYWLDIALNFLTWLFKQYFKNFFLALILLWLWWYQEKGSLKIRNPLSFLFCLLIYPIVIIRTWYEKINDHGHYLVMTVEYRRRQRDLFALFSENEIAELKERAKSEMNLVKFRKDLELQGLTVKHSFISALVVSIIFLSLPQSQLRADNEISKISFNFSEKALPDISGTCQYFQLMNLDHPAYLGSVVEIPPFVEELIGRIVIFSEKCLEGHKRRLKKFPVMVNNYFNLFLELIINQIYKKNEKIYCFNRYVVNNFLFFCSG
ncbi:MAG: hypothetical protein WCW65_03020, partial [Candidatus Paceibacterota bacterium]